MPEGENFMDENPKPMGPNQDYQNFGGWLQVWYWCLIIGGVFTLIGMVIPALFSIVASFIVGFIYALGVLISVGATCVSAVFNIRAASQLKARKPQFFDTFMFGMIISLGGSIISSLLQIRSASGVGSFIGTTIGGVIGVGIGVCLCVMYFSKSVRVNVFFGGRPLKNSIFWSWIKILPEFIISDTMPDPSKIQQLGSRPQQQENKDASSSGEDSESK